MIPILILCSIDRFCGMVDVHNYIIRVVNKLTFIYLLLNNLKFDESDPILGSNKGDLSCIFALINDNNAEFNLRVDHGLHELVRDWLLDSTPPVLVNEWVD